jgi:hypothetical protein
MAAMPSLSKARRLHHPGIPRPAGLANALTRATDGRQKRA